MARYLELAEEAMREIRARRLQEKTAALNKLFCPKCGTHFDTSVGRAKHQAYGCEIRLPRMRDKGSCTMPSCPKCGSFAFYPVAKGSECQTCGEISPTPRV